jgi:transposase
MTQAALDPATLPDDPDTLKKMVLEMAGQAQEFRRKIQDRDERIVLLEHFLKRFRRWQFGQKSEQIPEGQAIFGWYGDIVKEAEHSAEPERAPRARTRPKRGGYRVIPKDIPREVVTVDLPPEEKACPGCKTERTLIGWEESRQLDYHPASFFERIVRRAKYACLPCEKHVQTAPLPVAMGPIERGLPGYGLLAQVIISKYCDHTPLYRQSGIYGRHGVEIPRSTLCGWVGQAIPLLEPIVAAMRADILSSRILKTDDTVVNLQMKGLGRTAQARMWGYLGDAEHNQVVYEFSPDRKQEHPLRFLANYKGKVQADAYKGYDKLFLPGSEREELGCWAHTRRYFFDARDTDPERGGTALGYIRMLYEVEWASEKMDAAQRAALRRERSVPILKEFQAWLHREILNVLPQSPMGQAFHYALAQWTALTRYVDDGDADIDNNAMERRLRGIVIGRKNYLFMGSEAGGAWAAVAYSLIESCKLNGVEPYRYLKNVLRQVWTHPANRIEELMPRLWRPPPEGT